MSRGIKKAYLVFFFLILLLGVSHFAFAQTDPGLEPISKEIELSSEDPRILAVRIIQIFLGFLSLVLLGLIIWGGYVWMTAKGEEDKVEEAKRILTNAVAGFIIILLSLSISQFLLKKFMQAGMGPVGIGGGAIPGGADPFPGRGAFVGVNLLDYHIPARNARDVSRDTPIVLQFKEPMRVDSLVSGDKANPRAIILTSEENPEEHVTLTQEFVDEEGKLFIFRPAGLLGSALNDVKYSVLLTEAIVTRTGAPAFGRAGYSWWFVTSTRTDTTPPHVVSVVPKDGSTEPRNTIVSLTFSEPVLPSPIFTGGAFNVSNAGGVLDGRFTAGNGLTTYEFRTNDSCGRNSCGDEIFCFPANENLTIRARAAAPSAQPPRAKLPYDGIVDLAGNALDGNENNNSEGSPADDVVSKFSTNDTIDLVPPVILSTTPRKDEADVSIQVGIEANFSKPISASTVNTETFSLNPPSRGGFRVGVVNREDRGSAFLDTYSPYLEASTLYEAQATSGIRDTRQNCFMGAGP